VTGPGDNTSPDWQITGVLTVNLRAEGQNGRVYTLTIQSADASGNTTTASLPITVEKTKTKKKGEQRSVAALCKISVLPFA
jgi:hypothetical protein